MVPAVVQEGLALAYGRSCGNEASPSTAERLTDLGGQIRFSTRTDVLCEASALLRRTRYRRTTFNAANLVESCASGRSDLSPARYG